MNRSPTNLLGRTEASKSRSTSSNSGGSSITVKRVILALGIVAIAYLVARRIRSRRSEPAIDESAEDWEPQSAQESPGTAYGGNTAETGAEAVQPGAPSHVDETMSDDEVEERVEPNVDEEPAPPGGMNVDDEIVEDETPTGGTQGAGDDTSLSGQDHGDHSGDEGRQVTTDATESGDELDELGGPDRQDEERDAEEQRTEEDENADMLGQNETDMEGDESAEP